MKKGRSDLYFKDLATYACVVGEERKLGIFGGTGLDLDVRVTIVRYSLPVQNRA
ncbi:MAG: hypothetical protein ACLU4N_13690 [Butyricimonas faecihominis]